MTNYFNDCYTAEEVKATFKRLAKELHPDNGGTDAEFKEMYRQYETAFNRCRFTHTNFKGERYESKEGTEQYAYDTNAAPEQYANIIRTLLKIKDLEVELLGSWLWVTGNTKERKDTLKGLGFRYCGKKQAWSFHFGAYHKKTKNQYNMDDLRGMYKSTHFRDDDKATALQPVRLTA